MAPANIEELMELSETSSQWIQPTEYLNLGLTNSLR